MLALDHPGQVASLTLVSTRPVAPGPVDPDLPGPRGGDEEAVRASGAGLDRSRQRGRLHDRFHAADVRVSGIRLAGCTGGWRVGPRPNGTHGEGVAGEPPRHMFGAIDCQLRWRERHAEITAPILVIQPGTRIRSSRIATGWRWPRIFRAPTANSARHRPGRAARDSYVVDALLRHTSDTRAAGGPP